MLRTFIPAEQPPLLEYRRDVVCMHGDYVYILQLAPFIDPRMQFCLSNTG